MPTGFGLRPGAKAPDEPPTPHRLRASRRLYQGGPHPGAPAARPALEHVRVMQKPVEQRGDRGGVAEQLSPLVDRPVGGEHRGGPLVAAHDQLEQVLGGGVGQLAHAEVVDDEQVRAGQLGEVVLAGLGERRLGEFFEEGVRFAVEDAVALLDCGAPDGLGEVTLARTGLADEQNVFALGDEACGGELEDERAVDLLVEGEVEAVERAVGVPESGLLVPGGRRRRAG